MTTAFLPVNSTLGGGDVLMEATTPTTPRAPQMSSPYPAVPNLSMEAESSPSTPTRHSFGGINGQKPLPASFSSEPISNTSQEAPKTRPNTLTREDSHRSVNSNDSQDIEMGDSDGEEGDSDGESVEGETGRPSKKKKGQRFFCTEFPPCNLSFTRSEHLARHIRKHTGERPFQCHCARRFSRLDNLRQHAQTVHVNEEIPGDSLAATGTRFQRQIRTDRVRPAGARSRASTAGSQGGHSRGHSRNLSSSSIGSTASTISRDDNRRRPPALIMAQDPASRNRLTLDTMRGQQSIPSGAYAYSPSGPSTPTSTSYSNGPGSPSFGSSLGSPISTIPRNLGLLNGRTPNRRLSVPSGANPFQSPHGGAYPPPYMSPLASSNASINSSNSSVFASPTSSVYSISKRDSMAAEAEWRRRTWHASTYSNLQRPATSGLSYYQTPDAPRPAFVPQAASATSQTHRLPGIETFDQITHRPQTPTRPGTSPMMIDAASSRTPYQGPSDLNAIGPNDRRGHASWDMSLHQNLTKLDIANGTPPKEPTIWANQAIADIHIAGSAASSNPSAYRPQLTQASSSQESQKRPAESDSAQPTTPRRNKRHGWYNGPLQVPRQDTLQRTSPEDSSSSDGVPTPSTSALEYHPSIVHSNGYIETSNTPTAAAATQHTYASGTSQSSSYPLPAEPHRPIAAMKDTDMSGLDALVAVATSEDKATVATAQ